MNQNGSIVIFVIALAVIVVVGIFTMNRISTVHEDVNLSQPSDSTETSTSFDKFTFSAAGDFDNNSRAEATLGAINKTETDFTLALGDLGYVGLGNETAWCDKVKNIVGAEHPFQIVAGNHDDGIRDGDITAYAECLPNKISGTVGDYGIEYYFDYNKAARFIMISPDINNYGYDYTNDSEHLNWVIDTVRDARTKGLDWIFVGMHKNCITTGEKVCEIGEDLLNTLVDLKVDVILQGHEHAYFRSKQLVLDAETCPAITINDYDAECIADDDNDLKKGEGSVIVISGAAGRLLRDSRLNDPERPYFTAFNSANEGNSYGFSLFELSSDGLSAEFIPSIGEYRDSFTIR